MRRHSVNKYKSAKKFRKNVSQVKAANVSGALSRGGWRL